MSNATTGRHASGTSGGMEEGSPGAAVVKAGSWKTDKHLSDGIMLETTKPPNETQIRSVSS